MLSGPEADRAALIGRLSQRDDAEWLAEVLSELEVDRKRFGRDLDYDNLASGR